ncbi:hypothetical protein CTEN210_10315 [Chaetoceros tenuissimus]|uniref:Uncharacterized protein n=1 Tax=Chaetoceros tenuissimus TaxID=426638 RepID=A0AAD3H8H1_9STRA|nr:hypothetical protein CTEN210_10315 [Chaetoceros tenuissimus]
MKFHLLTSYPLFLLGTTFVSHMSQMKMADALYIDGMVRLFRGEGNLNDDANGQHAALDVASSSFAYVNDTPGSQTSRQVAQFSGSEKAVGSATGLPSGAEPRAMVAWFKWDGVTSENGPFGYGGGGYNNYYYWDLNGTQNRLDIDVVGYDEGVNPVISTVTAGTWYHVSVAFDGTNNIANVYGAHHATGSPSALPATQLDRVAFGGHPTAATESYFGGSIADFAIFNRALTDAEVAAIYSAPEGLKAIDAVGDTCIDAGNLDSVFLVNAQMDRLVPLVHQIQNAGLDYHVTLELLLVKFRLGIHALLRLTALLDFAQGLHLHAQMELLDQIVAPVVTAPQHSASPTSALMVRLDRIVTLDCSSGFCSGVDNTCTSGDIGASSSSGNDCSSGFCSSIDNTCTTGDNDSSCASASDCSSGYCSPTSSTCTTRPILDPCHGITCSNHGKCKGNGLCHCEDTFIQTNDGKDCACPNRSFLIASVNRCYAPTSSPTPSPTSSPVTASPTSSPTSIVTNAPTPDTPLDNPCEDGSGTFTVNNKEVGCDWLSKNKKREQKRKDTYCALNEVKLMCPSTCDVCACVDSSSYTFELKNGVNEVGCDWISKNSNKVEKRRAKYCTDDYDDGAVMNACRKSCNLC